LYNQSSSVVVVIIIIIFVVAVAFVYEILPHNISHVPADRPFLLIKQHKYQLAVKLKSWEKAKQRKISYVTLK
jgi:hypothetical protein